MISWIDPFIRCTRPGSVNIQRTLSRPARLIGPSHSLAASKTSLDLTYMGHAGGSSLGVSRTDRLLAKPGKKGLRLRKRSPK